MKTSSTLAATATVLSAVLHSTLVSAAPRRSTTTESTAIGSLSVHVDGNRLVDGSGHPLRLLGVDRSGTEYACEQGWGIFDGPSDATSVAAIRSWLTNAVRVPLNEDCWLGINGVSPAYGGSAYRAAVVTYVNQLNQAGIVAIVDLHWGAPGTTLAAKQESMPDADHAGAFWQSAATTFAGDPGVIFDLFNEPHDVTWSCWRQVPEGDIGSRHQQYVGGTTRRSYIQTCGLVY